VHGLTREVSSESSEQSPSAPGVAANEDLGDLRHSAVETSELELVDLAAIPAVRVDELVVENPEREIDPRRLAHPWPPFVSTSSGIAAIATSRMIAK
jgi:hypothetical protein